VAVYGIQTLANAEVRDFQVSLGWTHAFSSKVLNEFHAGASDDNQIANPTGLAAATPTIILDSPASFSLGNAPFSIGRVFERQWSVADRVDYVVGRHTFQLGFDMNRAFDGTPISEEPIRTRTCSLARFERLGIAAVFGKREP
jgi:hypothetical protein